MESRRTASLATARVIPPLLALLVSYASYVLIGPLSINYLLNPPSGIPARVAAGIALPIVWVVLLIPLAVTWLRLLVLVWTDPGYIPLGPGALPPSEVARPTSQEAQSPTEAEIASRPGLSGIWTKDVFVCDQKGYPIWCDRCQNWKPDRTHHNQDVGRCTRKMDHFCPWVGGVVGERCLKFFVQFLCYSAIFSTYLMIVFAYFVAERKEVQWIVALALSGFFVFFTAGMIVNTVHLVLMNLSTIEHAGITGNRKLYLAVLLPPEMQTDPLAPPPPVRLSPGSSDSGSEQPLSSDFEDPAHLDYFRRSSRPRRRSALPTSSKLWEGTVTYPLRLPLDKPPVPAPPLRTFAIISVPPKVNPWDLGSPLANFRAVMGRKLSHWVIPYRHSPCCDHSSMVSDFPLGPQFEQLLIDVGLVQERDVPYDGTETALSRRRKRRLDAGWQNGERPDWWVTENEARRQRKRRKREQEREEARLADG